MRKYTAIYTDKSKKQILHSYEASNHKSALAQAEALPAWPNVLITDDTYSVVPGYGEMIYMNGIIPDNGGGFLPKGPASSIEALFASCSVYDAAVALLGPVQSRIGAKVCKFTGEPTQIAFFKKLRIMVSDLEDMCKAEAKKNNVPCRW